MKNNPVKLDHVRTLQKHLDRTCADYARFRRIWETPTREDKTCPSTT